MRGTALALGLLLPVTGCRPVDRLSGVLASPRASGAVQFTDVTAAAGIQFKHTSGRSGRLYTPETAGSGCAFLDYNNDGRLDLYLVNGTRLPGFQAKGPFYSALYRNDGNGRFTDVTRAAGLAVECYGMGVAVADYDGDQFQDLYLTALGPNHLFHNRGDGTFEEVTERAGVGDPRFSTSAAWLDYDRDGWLDLFVCDYCRWSPETNKVCTSSTGRKEICGPTSYAGVPSTLYHNNGDGTFTDVTQRAGVYQTTGKALGVVVWDYNSDGWLDLVVANDLEPNLLYRNNGNGTFTERGVESGIAYGSESKVRAGMGIDTGDTTNMGRESVLIGNFTEEGLGQFLSDGQGQFTDVAQQTGLYEPSLPFLTFGLAFVDYDYDGFKDIFTANGHVGRVDDQHVDLGDAMRMQVFQNDGSGQFREVGAKLGPALMEKRVWRGLAVGDYDNDGDPDLLLSANDGAPALLRNEAFAPLAAGSQDGPGPTASREPRAASATEGSFPGWLQVKVIGAGGNRDGLGTKVTVTAGGMRQLGWIRSGSSYCSEHERKAFFGLGSAAQVEEVEVRFPSGAREVIKGVKGGQMIVVQEAKALVAQGPPGTAERKLLPQVRRRVAVRS